MIGDNLLFYVGLFFVAPFWGFFSPKLFLNGWLGFLGILACFIGLFRRKITFQFFLRQLFSHVTEMLFGTILLVAGFYVFYALLPFGKSSLEVLFYWIFSTIQLCIIIPQLSKRIDDIWQRATVPPSKDLE